MNGTRTCIYPNCERAGLARRLCKSHYAVAVRTGTLTEFPAITPAERLHAALEPTATGCMEWQRYRTPDGYGRIWYAGSQQSAHRVAWQLVNGAIPEGIEVCHRCDNPPCCNVEHLFLGTHAENIADRDAKGRGRGGTINNFNGTKEVCKRGHAFTEENTIVRASGLSKRICRTCERWRSAAKKRGIPMSEFLKGLAL